MVLGRSDIDARSNRLLIRSARRAAAALAPVALLAVWLAPSAFAAQAPFAVTVSPPSVTAGSSGNVVAFGFTASGGGKATISLQVPAASSGSPWTRPQSSNPGDAGFVRAARQSCKAASVSSVKGPASGPWTILVAAKCSKGQRFVVNYGGVPAGSQVTAATAAGTSTFAAKVRPQGSKRFRKLAPQPVVTVLPGQASQLTLDGLANGAAGVAQTFRVTARDAFGNTAPDYRGTVEFSSSGRRPPFNPRPPKPFLPVGWEIPGDHTFTAADAGVHSFGTTPYFAGRQTLAAADADTETIAGTRAVMIGPGSPTEQLQPRPTEVFDVAPGQVSVIDGQGMLMRFDFIAVDPYGNINTSETGQANVEFENLGMDGSPLVRSVSQNLANGLLSVHHTIPIAPAYVPGNELLGFEYSLPPTVPSSFGSITLLSEPGIEPDPDVLQLDIGDPNPDGTYDGALVLPTLNMHLIPDSIVVAATPNLNLNPDNTIDINVEGITIETQSEVLATLTLTTPANPATGEMLPAKLPKAGDDIPITGCLNDDRSTGTIDFKVPGAGIDIELPAAPCPDGFLSVDVHQETTPLVQNTALQSSVSAAVNITDPDCKDPLKNWDASQTDCVP